ncbi:UNVERIFIED_CONTAM: hypothetical protein PYX00_008488 [Menopon gallinae]|uniref:Uncharacterized protein n=1 Tax=Menopon gallinae TaxID=328185 RepID=A0AAW2HP36_9NEOP
MSKGNGVFLQQTVYYQHETVHSVPTLGKRITSRVEAPEERDSDVKSREISQSCCFLSAEDKSMSDETYSRERVKDQRKAVDSVTTLANLIDTLETLKIQTYKKLKEIESINHEIRGMRASCENIEEKHWLRHAEKIMSRQKRFTIRSSQCCLSELKKLAKECNFEKIMDESVISDADDGKSYFIKTADGPLSCSNASGDKLEVGGWERFANKPLNLNNSERFSRKAQKLIRSFFEDIKESEEAQINVEKSLLLKKFEKLSKRKSDLLNVKFPQGPMFVTKKMMNLGQIREQFFTEIKMDEKAVTPVESKIVPAGKKKKNKSSFFKISLSAFDGDKKNTAKKASKRSFFTKSAMAWINNRINSLHDTSPVIPLRITDIELKTGSIITKNKSKQSVKTTSIRKIVSDEHMRTEVSSYLSESLISGFSDKQSRYSKHNRTQRSIIQGVENNMDANGEVSILSNSANISSGTTIDSDRRKLRKSRKDLWEDCSSTSEYQKDLSGKREVHYKRTEHVKCRNSMTRHIVERILSTSSESSIVIGKQSKREMLTLISNKTTKKDMTSSRDVSVDATENISEDSPRKKRLRLESIDNEMVSPRDVDVICYTEAKSRKVSYAENECQVDIIPTITSFGPAVVQYQDKDIRKVDVSVNISLDKSSKEDNLQSPLFGSQSDLEKESPSCCIRVIPLNTSAETRTLLPVLLENEIGESESKEFETVKNDDLEIANSVVLQKSADYSSELEKDLPSVVEHSAEQSDAEEHTQALEETSLSGLEVNSVVNQVVTDGENATVLNEPYATIKRSDTGSVIHGTPTGTDDDTPQNDSHFENFNQSLSDEQSDKKEKVLTDATQDSEGAQPYDEKKPSRILSQQGSRDLRRNASRVADRDVSQNELSEFNEYDLQTDSNGTVHYSQEQRLRSGETTPSMPSSDNEKQEEETSIATGSSLLRINSQQKPFSTESFNILKNSYEVKHRRRRSCVKKKSKHMVRRNSSLIKKQNKIGNCLDFTNLTEEEQLKIISANVANFVKRKLVEHKQFFDFEKNDPMVFDMGNWGKMEEDVTPGDSNVLLETAGETDTGIEVEKVDKCIQEVDSPKPEPQESDDNVPPEKKLTATLTTVQESKSSPTPPQSPPKSPRQQSIPRRSKKENDSSHPNTPRTPQSQAPSTVNAGQGGKSDNKKHNLDFIKLNKMMASKYKRSVPERTRGILGKRIVKKEAKKEVAKAPLKPASAPKEIGPPPRPTYIPVMCNDKPQSEGGQKSDNLKSGASPRRGIRTTSAESPRRPLPRGQKSDIPVPQFRDPSTSPRRVGKVNVRSVSASPTAAKSTPEQRKIPSPPLALQKKNQPKKRLIPTYTLTSYLTAPNELIEYQQRELDKYINQRSDITNFFLEESKEKCERKKSRNGLSKKNLDYLIMLQKRINHEISANIENSMNYVKTLLSQDYNGTAIIEKAPVKNSLDVFDPGKGIVLIEMNDQFDCSSSSSDFSEESGFYCLYQGNNGWDSNQNIKSDIIVKRNESGDSGMVDTKVFEELQNDTDSSYNCEVSIVLNPRNTDDKHETSDVLKKYIYHLGGGEEPGETEETVAEKSWSPKPQQKRRKERVLDIPREMKRKLLDLLECEMKCPPTSVEAPSSSILIDDECPETKIEDIDLENSEIISKISEMVLQYLDEYDRNYNSEDEQVEGTEDGTDHDEKLPDTESQ